MHMRVGGPHIPKHDRAQCIVLAGRKIQEAKRALGDLIDLLERPIDESHFCLESPMDVFVRLRSRLNRTLPGPDCDFVLAMVKVKLGTLLAIKDKPAPLERIVALLGEGFPVMLHDDDESPLGTAIGIEAIEPQAKALVMLGREAEPLAWMREYTPRVEAYNKDMPPVVAAYLHGVWARIYTQSKDDRADECLWRDWDEAERVSRKAVALAKASEGHLENHELAGYETTLGCVLFRRSKYTDAAQVLSDAFTRIKNTQSSKRDLENTALLLGQALLQSGRAAEAEAHFRACLNLRRKNRQILFGERFMMVSTIFLAEALVRQDQTEEALALVEDMEGWSSYAGDWTEYCHSLQQETREGYGAVGPEYSPYLFSILLDKNKLTTAGQAAKYFRTATACRERGDLEEAEAHLWKAMDAYKLAKEKSAARTLGNSEKLLPCLDLLINVLEQKGGSERLVKAEELRKEMEENKVSVEAMYAMALGEARREGEERREARAKRKESNKRRGGKRFKKRQSKKGEETGGRKSAPDDDEKKEEGAHLSLEDLILEDEGDEQKEEKEEVEEEVCAICLGPMNDEEEEEDEVVCRLQCSHEFHGGCMDSWTSNCTRKGLPLTCPTCRQPLMHG